MQAVSRMSERRIRLACSILHCMVALVLGHYPVLAAQGIARSPPPDDRQLADSLELIRLEAVWNDAHVRGDAEALDHLWANGLVVTVPGMSVMTKPDVIGFVRFGRMRFLRYETSDLRIQVYENAALVTGRPERARDFEGRVIADHWRFTKMYVRRTGEWRVVAFHASQLAS